MKLQELLKSIDLPAYNVQSILCRLEDVRRSTISTLKMLPKHVWHVVGALRPGSTSAFSGMPGEPRYDNEYKNKQHKKAMQAEIKEDPSDALRKAGL